MSDDLVEAIRRIMPDAVEIAPRVVTALAPLTVDKMGLPLPVIDALGGGLARMGDTLLVATTATGVPRALVNLTPPPARGVVSAVGATSATVTVDGLPVTLAWSGVAPAVGNTVGIVWAASGSWCTRLSQPTPTNPVGASVRVTSASPPTGERTYDLVAPAITVCSAVAGAWTTWGSYGTTAVQGYYAGSTTGAKSGYFFYGDRFGGRAGRVCTRAQMRLRRGPAGLGSSTAIRPHLYLHAAPTKPDVPPALQATTFDGPAMRFGEERVFDIPITAGQALLDGTAAGLAISYAGSADYAQWDGIADMAAAGQLTLSIKEQI